METAPPIRLAIADDHVLFRRGLVSIFSEAPGIELLYEASDGQELVEKIAENRPDVVLMDLQMPRMDGIKATQHIRQHFPEVKVVILSMHDEDNFVIHLMELGANGYLLKDADPEEVDLAIRTVASEDYYYGPFLTRVMHRKMLDKSRKREPPHFDTKANLSAREIEVLRLICEGHTTAQIADKIFLSDRTVEGHRNRIMEKIGAKNTAGMVVYAVKNDIY
ncbi:MAG: response regulator transcription factor [Cytophagaceae bacterium]|nr:response regulator transcription factor [Cytophagaceae bacterium]